MTPPIACVWWPQATAKPREPRLQWLRHWSPFAEAASDDPGLYFLDASGLAGLFDSQAAWAHALAAALTRGPRAWLLLGHHKTALWALARAAAMRHAELAAPATLEPFAGAKPPQASVAVAAFASPAQEQAALRQVSLATLALPQKELDAAHRWRLHCVGDALALPLPSVQQHVGPTLMQWLRDMHRPSAPLRPTAAPPSAVAALSLDDPTDDRERLLFFVKQLVDDVLEQASSHRRRVQSLHLGCWARARDNAAPFVRRLEAARPSLDARRWLELLRLALEHAPMAAPVAELRLSAQMAVPTAAEQLLLWPERSTQQLEAACQALAKVRSAWGDAAVTRVELVDAHLPEARFRYRPWQQERLPLATPIARQGAALAPGHAGLALPRVRWMWPTPQPLPKSWHSRLHAAQAAQPPAQAWVRGPFVYNVQWWQPQPCDRDYMYIGAAQAAPVWTFFDRQTRRWWWHGSVD